MYFRYFGSRKRIWNLMKLAGDLATQATGKKVLRRYAADAQGRA
jgi:hypothetical protein